MTGYDARSASMLKPGDQVYMSEGMDEKSEQSEKGQKNGWMSWLSGMCSVS